MENKIEDLVSVLLQNVPNFIETDFIDNENGTYTLCANFEHPDIEEDYCQQEFIFSKVTFDKDLNLINSNTEITWKKED